MNAEGVKMPELLGLLESDAYLSATQRLMLENFVVRWKVSAFHALLLTELMHESELADALAKTLKIRRARNVRSLTFASEALKIIGFESARAWECLPVRGADGGLELVFADPTRVSRIDELIQGFKGSGFTLSVAERSDIVRAIDELYPLSAQLPSLYGDL